MRKGKLIVLMIMLSVFAFGQQESIHKYSTTTLEGDSFDLSSLKGKKVLIVNTASKCGLTPQYEGLEALYKKYGGDKFTIVGFPANNFRKQEPGSADDIREFCTQNYGVSFLMMHKISVKGEDMDPIYQWLTQKDKNGVMDSDVKWNFQKYMIDEEGKFVGKISPKTKPDDEEIIQWIEGE